MSVVTAAQILRNIAASADPFDEVERTEPPVDVRDWRPTVDPFADLTDGATVNATTVAQRLQVSTHTVWRWAREDKLPTLRKANHRDGHLFRVGDVRRALGFTTGTVPTVPASAVGAVG